jgi:hypothetical protein
MCNWRFFTRKGAHLRVRTVCLQVTKKGREGERPSQNYEAIAASPPRLVRILESGASVSLSVPLATVHNAPQATNKQPGVRMQARGLRYSAEM